MNRSLLTDEVISFPLDKGIKEVMHQLDQNIPRIHVEGLKGSSIALFLAHLVKSSSKSIVVLTSNQSTGEKLIGDLRYFFQFYEIARFTKEEVDGFRDCPEKYLLDRFGGGWFKLNFYQGPTFIVCVNFKPKGEPKWKNLVTKKSDGPIPS